VVRRLGSGRKPLTQSDPTLLTDLESLVEPVTRVTQNHLAVDNQEYGKVGARTSADGTP